MSYIFFGKYPDRVGVSSLWKKESTEEYVAHIGFKLSNILVMSAHLFFLFSPGVY